MLFERSNPFAEMDLGSKEHVILSILICRLSKVVPCNSNILEEGSCEVLEKLDY